MKKFSKKFFPALFALLALIAPLYAHAAEKAVPGIYHRPTLEDKKYYVCREDKHCATASLPCGRIVVLNTRYQKEVQGWSDFVEPRFKCLATSGRQKADKIHCDLGGNKDPDAAGVCRGEITEVARTLSPDNPLAKNQSYCETIDDCAVVVGPCGKKIIVNKQLKNPLQKDYDNIRDLHMEKCLYPDNRTVERLHCRKNTCEADLKIPDQNYQNEPVDMRRKPRYD